LVGKGAPITQRTKGSRYEAGLPSEKGRREFPREQRWAMRSINQETGGKLTS